MATGFRLSSVGIVLTSIVLGGAAYAFTRKPPVAPATAPSALPSPRPKKKKVVAVSPEITKWCTDLRKEIAPFHWNINPCVDGVHWIKGGASVQGRPLVYAEFGNPKSTNVSLIMAMVHGDEITPVYIGIELAKWLRDHQSELKDSYVILAPLVNPDGFYRRPRTRMNANGVDVNRNFPTHDWEKGAKEWVTRYRKNPRRYPGSAPHSEPETRFQEMLIRTKRPEKIMSIHSPLNHMDYDGPNGLTLSKFPRDYVHECIRLRNELKAKSSGWFPGSLGNYAGHELGIPTMTLELPTANPRMARTYWMRFKEGIRTMIKFTMPDVATRIPHSKLSSNVPPEQVSLRDRPSIKP